MEQHQHMPDSEVSHAQTIGGEIRTKCQECGCTIHKLLFSSNISPSQREWKEVVTKERHALILVTTELDYLTADGEETEESGWDEVAKNLAGYLEGFNKFQNATRPVAKFIEWEVSDA